MSSRLARSGHAEPDRLVCRVNIGHLIASYGYLALFALVAAESLGIPLPGETALITAGIYAGHTHLFSRSGPRLPKAAGAAPPAR